LSALMSLARAYERLAQRDEVPKFGYARTPISFSVRIDREGKPTCLPIDLREAVGKGNRLIGRRMDVPTFLGKRTSGIHSNFLWDKTQYILGVYKPDPSKSANSQAKEATRVVEMQDDCLALHRKHLASETDEGLVAILRFLEHWEPRQFDGWPNDMKGENVVFELDGDRRFIHERPAARALWLKVVAAEPAIDAICLVEGNRGRVALTHPPIKGVKDAQPSGALLVSFNLDAFTSYGHEQGENAPVSEAAAFAYTTALNRFLEKDSGHRIQIGDATTVFWADGSDVAANEAEGVFAALLRANVDDTVEARKVGAILQAIREGRPHREFDPELTQGVRFSVLGLGPNEGRLSVRFYFENSFEYFVENLAAHFSDLAIDPSPFKLAPAVWNLISETAVHVAKEAANGTLAWKRPKDSVPPPGLAGELMRSVLTGRSYPRSLLARIIERVRSERGRVTGTRAAICKAVANRDLRLRRLNPKFETSHQHEEISVALDRANPHPAYRLGRLFALMERTQQLASEPRHLNATIRDRFFGSASTTPARVFPLHMASFPRSSPNAPASPTGISPSCGSRSGICSSMTARRRAAKWRRASSSSSSMRTRLVMRKHTSCSSGFVSSA
jgi:CRISPR-associated protein Csd1